MSILPAIALCLSWGLVVVLICASFWTTDDDDRPTTAPAGPRILTAYDPKPIPLRYFDWSAVDDSTYGGEPGEPIGYGATEQEAIADLLEQLDDMDDSHDPR